MKAERSRDHRDSVHDSFIKKNLPYLRTNAHHICQSYWWELEEIKAQSGQDTIFPLIQCGGHSNRQGFVEKHQQVAQ